MLNLIGARISLLGRGEWPAIAFVLALIILIGWAALAGGGFYRLKPNFGFGPDWNCTYVGQGDPVCVKQPAKPTAR
jgi:hypothetical protein